MKQNGFINVLIVVLGVVLVGVVGYVMFTERDKAIPDILMEPGLSMPSPLVLATEPSSWKIYLNKIAGFEFRYPSTFKIEETLNDSYHWSLIGDGSFFWINFIMFEDRSPESLLECATPNNPASGCKGGNFVANGVTYQTINFRSSDERGIPLGYAMMIAGELSGKTIYAYAHLGVDKVIADKALQELNIIFSTFKFIK